MQSDDTTTWTNISPCDSWAPNEQADHALNELLMRKLTDD